MLKNFAYLPSLTLDTEVYPENRLKSGLFVYFAVLKEICSVTEIAHCLVFL